ncbi:hypothetical protein G6F42_026199 [Rhizopus arrhizus]|nr:hypothetical protein G6F42_026199 [Rhizopus arrhizus]
MGTNTSTSLAASVIAILVHNDYVDHALTTLNKAGIKPLEEFNPRDAANLRDSKFADLTNDERHLKMCEIHTASLLRALDRVRVEVRPSVARSFFNKSWITQEQYQDCLNKSRPSRQDTTKVNTSFLDVVMNEVDPQDPLPPTQDQPSPTGAGEPAEEI